MLRGVDLAIPYGAAVALVGLNGAGKSTLVKLLCRFYDPQRGAILWDGVDLRELSTSELRERIGALFQDYMSYDLTAAENIGLGDVTHLDDAERIRAAAGRAGIAATIEPFPRGYQTLLTRMFVDPAERGGPDTGRCSPAVSGSGWRSPAPCCGTGRICSSSTSRAPGWTRRPSTRSTTGCAAPGRRDERAHLASARRRPRRRPDRGARRRRGRRAGYA